MNRERIIILGLAILLGASLVLNFVLWNRARDRGASAGTSASGEPSASEARAGAPRERGSQGAYDIVPNPELKGRLGRIVIAFAEGADASGFRTVFYPAGKPDSLTATHGIVEKEMIPGDYDLEIGGARVSGIPVETGKDTRVRSGVLRLHGSDTTRFTLHEVGVADAFRATHGNSLLGLPARDYEVGVNGVREKVSVEPGKVADF